jgi:hypothetical protein
MQTKSGVITSPEVLEELAAYAVSLEQPVRVWA